MREIAASSQELVRRVYALFAILGVDCNGFATYYDDRIPYQSYSCGCFAINLWNLA